MPTFADLKSEYFTLWSTMLVRPDKAKTVDGIANRLMANKARYQGVEAKTGVPWFVIAALHNRESDADFSTYLGNGEPLNRVTRLVPKGRGPFSSWEEGAIDALKFDGLDKVTEWTPERACYEIEKFNGFGYRGKGINSPYLWSFTNNYTRGKYVSDGVWSSTAVDAQCGAIPILKRITEKDPSAKFKAKGGGTPGTVVIGTGTVGGAIGFFQSGYVKTAIAIVLIGSVIAIAWYFWPRNVETTK